MEPFIDLVKDIWDFLKVRKKYWLAPLIFSILLMGSLRKLAIHGLMEVIGLLHYIKKVTTQKF